MPSFDIIIFNYNFILARSMSVNFKINMPSIPTDKIRFKIQDVRQKGFLTKDNRFKENKEYLTKKFINSFNNLSPKKSIAINDEQFEDKSQQSTNPSSYFKKQVDNFRLMISQNKKNLLIKYEDKYKHYMAPIAKDEKYDKGFSFGKSVAHYDALDTELHKHYSMQLDETNDKSFQNYYFHQSYNRKTQMSDDDPEDEEYFRRKDERQKKMLEKRRVNRPSAAFKGEDRWAFLERQLKSKIKLGPGQYNPQLQNKKSLDKKTKKKKESKAKEQQQEVIPFQKMKSIIKSVVLQKNDKKTQQLKEDDNQEPAKNQTSCFILNNTDRFGSAVYPIVPKLNVPGPGAYQDHDTIEQRAKKLLVLQQQRILLQEWYNQ